MGDDKKKDVPKGYDDAQLTNTPSSSADPPPVYLAPQGYTVAADKKRGGSASPQPAAPPVDPTTLLPPTFRVGKSYIKPLVTVPELVNHLKFLACLHRLQEDVRECPTPCDQDFSREGPADAQVPDEVKWTAFCVRAAHRFQAWAEGPAVSRVRDKLAAAQATHGAVRPNRGDLVSVLAEADIDILMAWHTYLLNPRAYHDDLELLGGFKPPGIWGPFAGLKALGAFPLDIICERIDPQTYVFQPFQRTADQPSGSAPDSSAPPPALNAHAWTLVALSRTQSTVPVACPKCLTAVSLPVIGIPGAGSGLALPDMSFTCSVCHLVLTREVLRVGRFLRDLLRVRAGLIPHLAGMGDNAYADVKKEYGIPMSQALLNTALTSVMNPYKAYIDLSGLTVGELGDKLEWSQDKVREKLVEQTTKDGGFIPIVEGKLSGVRGKFRRSLALGSARAGISGAIVRLNRAYSVGTGLDNTVDLAPAIMRQASFVTNMQKIGWLQMNRWTNDQDPRRFYFIQKAAARYHAFLDLMNAHPTKFISPTLDIDLAWHTHQLHGAGYVRETTRHVGHLVNHDDAVADVALRNAYDETATLWAERFNTSYSGCGCPVPSKAQKVVDKARRRESSSGPSFAFWRRKSSSSTVAGTRPDVAAMSAETATFEDRAAECPSTHNRVHVTGVRKLEDMHENQLARRKRKPGNPGHEDPFTQQYEFVPQVNDPRKRKAAGGIGPTVYDPYWGVTPYAYGGVWGLGTPWALVAGVAVVGGIAIGAGAAAGE
ncbi:hypothetical protein Q8F55_004791 [Vanrija albida]|uniref:CxC5 like cysteine cluster associated with KDZ domain-containing protein n=1 Tax=Vanrija albida TaxID=181172 RepID=A0ABR3PZT1_9TREE